MRALHILELRQRINAVRARLNLSSFAWSDAELSAGMPIRAQHIIDLRTALHEVYAASTRTPPTYTDPTIEVGKTMMKVEHIMEIRAALIAVE